MKPCGLISLTTDFGIQDSYVGIIKGVMLAIEPQLRWVDLTHDLPPQDLWAARFQLAIALPYLPLGTVHLAVIDPGVGSDRAAIAIEFDLGWLVGPNNGIFSGVLERFPARRAVRLSNPTYWRCPDPSYTFHGRDIFAPVAAHLARGITLAELGEPLDLRALVGLSLESDELGDESDGETRGRIQAIDRFGNAITTIANDRVSGSADVWEPKVAVTWCLRIKGLQIPGGKIYGDRPIGAPIALQGSHGWLEIAVNGGSAQAQLGIQVGDVVDLRLGQGSG